MADLASKLEVSKLRRELGANDLSLEFLEGIPSDQLRELRSTISGSLFARHESRFQKIAGLTKILPTALTAKIASSAIGPVLSAQIANVLNSKDAIKLSCALKPEFLVEVSKHLDPSKVESIIVGLPSKLVIDVGQRLLAQDEHVTLGRFVSVVGIEESLGVVDGAEARDLLLVALYTEDMTALDAILSQVPEDRIRSVIQAALDLGQIEDALTVIGSLSTEGRQRLIGQAAELGVDERSQLIAAVDKNNVWGDIVTVVGGLPEASLRSLVNVPATLDASVIERVIQAVRDHDVAPAMAPVLLALDEEHLKVLQSVSVLHQAATQKWIVDHAGEYKDLAKTFIDDLKSVKK